MVCFICLQLAGHVCFTDHRHQLRLYRPVRFSIYLVCNKQGVKKMTDLYLLRGVTCKAQQIIHDPVLWG